MAITTKEIGTGKTVTITVKGRDGKEWSEKEYEQGASKRTARTLRNSGYKKGKRGFVEKTRKDIVLEEQAVASTSTAETVSDQTGQQIKREIPTIQRKVQMESTNRRREMVAAQAEKLTVQPSFAEMASQQSMNVQQSSDPQVGLRSGRERVELNEPPFKAIRGQTTATREVYGPVIDSFGGGAPSPGAVSPVKRSGVGGAVDRTQQWLRTRGQRAEMEHVRTGGTMAGSKAAAFGVASGVVGGGVGIARFAFAMSPPTQAPGTIYNMGKRLFFYASRPSMSMGMLASSSARLRSSFVAGSVVGEAAVFWGTGKLVGEGARLVTRGARVRQSTVSQTLINTELDSGHAASGIQGKAKVGRTSVEVDGSYLEYGKKVGGTGGSQVELIGGGEFSVTVGKKSQKFIVANTGIGVSSGSGTRVYRFLNIGKGTAKGAKKIRRVDAFSSETPFLKGPTEEVGELLRLQGGRKEAGVGVGRVARSFEMEKGGEKISEWYKVETGVERRMGKRGSMGKQTSESLGVGVGDNVKSLRSGLGSDIVRSISVEAVAEVNAKAFSKVGNLLGVGALTGQALRPSVAQGKKSDIASSLREISVTRSESVSDNIFRTGSSLENVFKSGVASALKTGAVSATAFRTIQSGVFRTTQITTPVPGIPVPPIPVIGPPPPPPFIGGGLLGGGGGFGGSLSSRRVGKQPRGYTPTFTSASLGIKGKASELGVKSGLGIRPIGGV